MGAIGQIMRLAAARIIALSETTPASTGTTMSEGLGLVGDFLEALWGWVAGCANAIVSNWVLVLFVVAIPVAGWIVSFVFRLKNGGGGKGKR